MGSPSEADQSSTACSILITILPRVEAGLNTSTVVPASRKRRQKGNAVSDETVKYSYWDQ
jgi:hypothetical protein